MRGLFLVVLVVLVLVGCEQRATQIVVALQTDMVPLAELDGIRVTVDSEDGRPVRVVGEGRDAYDARVSVDESIAGEYGELNAGHAQAAQARRTTRSSIG